jgi:hypothetical protein
VSVELVELCSLIRADPRVPRVRLRSVEMKIFTRFVRSRPDCSYQGGSATKHVLPLAFAGGLHTHCTCNG